MIMGYEILEQALGIRNEYVLWAFGMVWDAMESER